jgi:hypothetical protein
MALKERSFELTSTETAETLIEAMENIEQQKRNLLTRLVLEIAKLLFASLIK